jgi:hypothetical protein
VKTIEAGNELIAYDLVILNSGSIPARNIRIAADQNSLDQAFGKGATDDDKIGWLSCFDQTILILQNGERTSCSFGTTAIGDSGFWKYKAIIGITIQYEGWFRGWFEKTYCEKQDIQIVNSESFTDYAWGSTKVYSGAKR